MSAADGSGRFSPAGLGSRPILTAILGALTIAFSGILVRLADVPPSTAAVFRCVYALPVLGVLAYVEQRRYGPRGLGQRRLALIAGVFFALDLVLWHHAIDEVGAGLATVLGNLQVVIVGLVAWLTLSERPSNRILVAVPIAMVGVLLISGVVGAGAYGDNPALGVVFGVGTAVAYSAFILVLRQGNRDTRRPAGPLFDATVAAGIGSLVIGLPLGEIDLAPSWPAHGWLIALALSSQVLGWLLISVSLPRLPAAVTSVVLTIQPVGSVVLAMVLLGESPSWVQLVGVVAILAGLMLATVGGHRITRTRMRRSATAPLDRASVVPRLLLAGGVAVTAFTLASVIPVPRDTDRQRATLMAQVRERFPGWEIANIVEGQENSWVVAVECGSDRVGFRLIRDPRPVNGLPWNDYWISPDNAASRHELTRISETIGGWLVWRARPPEASEVSCRDAAAAQQALQQSFARL